MHYCKTIDVWYFLVYHTADSETFIRDFMRLYPEYVEVTQLRCLLIGALFQ